MLILYYCITFYINFILGARGKYINFAYFQVFFFYNFAEFSLLWEFLFANIFFSASLGVQLLCVAWSLIRGSKGFCTSFRRLEQKQALLFFKFPQRRAEGQGSVSFVQYSESGFPLESISICIPMIKIICNSCIASHFN